MESSNLSLPIIGAFLAAVVGGAVWAVIAIMTEYEIGFVAWAIGGLAGYSVFYLAKGKVNTTHQVIAVIASLIGILLGKYFIFGYFYTSSLSGIFGSEVVTLFQENISSFFGGMDFIFVLLAVVTAWQLPGKLANKAILSNPAIDTAE
ncbi:hypothetical protein [Fictibacillus halophilus]|uniref:hypothetical protein n=1 Tax=Fictibacillus halophilus TaxID=1610490 RepID=UPI001CFABE7B|nr:hypothetical protein [Fictibacillus halophilus]